MTLVIGMTKIKWKRGIFAVRNIKSREVPNLRTPKNCKYVHKSILEWECKVNSYGPNPLWRGGGGENLWDSATYR